MNRASILLSAQRAMLGNITPNMHAITVAYKDTEIVLRVYFINKPDEDDIELMSEILTSMCSDFSEIINAKEEFFIIGNDKSKLICLNDWVFMQH